MGEIIFEEWRVYEKLLIHDYMDHRAFFGRLQRQISSQYQRPIRILDLGCGDLTPILPLLQAVPLSRYVGIDESNGALTIANQRLNELGIPGELIHGDILSTLETLQENFDLVVASFSLHHLSDPTDKLRTLRAITQHLASDGMFALIDVFCTEQEPRSDYVERWIAYADRHYAALQPEEKKLLFDHVRARDYPISENHWHSLAEQAGLGHFEVKLRDQLQLNGLVTMMMNS
ncbi:MAG: class I SAM-dependent methyltransferase [Xanthomonadales bacterium]|nr:class I SAM-dependent methyltransferase [Xanthomonadales bacterium]